MVTKAELIENAERDRLELQRMDAEIQSLKTILADVLSKPDTSGNLKVI